jgi:hypothetical protein
MLYTNHFKWDFGIVLAIGLAVILSVAPFLSRNAYADDITFNLGFEGNTDDVSYLAQYGNWIDVDPYGSVWVPDVSSEWRPFTYGHWIWTDQGWAWVSYEPYGWLVFHYGDWDYRSDIGWFWIEGNQWSPARVDWLNYNGFCAWAPRPPVGVSWEEPWQSDGLRFWVVVRDRDLDRENIRNYELHRVPNRWEQNRSEVYHRPLGRHEFERITGHRLRSEQLQRGPVQVFMNRRNPREYHAMRPGENHQEHRRVEQRPQRRENHPQENRRGKASQAVGHRPENRHAQGNNGEYDHQGNQSREGQRAENRSGENRGMQLQRMILPERDRARVQKHRNEFERKVLGHKHENNGHHQEHAAARHKK